MRAESESEQAISFSASTLLFVTEITKNALSLRNTVLDGAQTLQLCFNWKKNRTSVTPCQNMQVWNLYGIWKIFSIPYIKFSFPFHTWVIPYSIRIFSFHSIPQYALTARCHRRNFEMREWTGTDALQEVLGATHASLFGQLSTWHLSLSLTSKPSRQTES